MTVKLDHITTIDFAPRTNLKGQGIGANWVFLLPRLDLHCVVCIGAPSKDMLPALQLISDELICTHPVPGEDLIVQSLERIPESSVDLIYVIDHRAVTGSEMKRLLKPDGLVYYEYHGQDRTGFATSENIANHFWLTPMLGNVQTAVPQDEKRGRDFLLQRQLFTSTVRHQTLERFGKRITRKNMPALASQEIGAGRPQTSSRSLKSAMLGFLRRARSGLIQFAAQVEQKLTNAPLTRGWTQRNGVILEMDKKAGRGVPDYLQASARRYGIDLSSWEWAFVARGDYPSQKLLFYLFEPRTQKPSTLIKMVREAQYNERLEREYRGLKHLDDVNFAQRSTIPNVVFQGYHHGLFFVAESVLDGQPFVQKTSLGANCRYAHFVVQWMIDLATATCTDGTGKEIAALLLPIYNRFVDVYQPTQSQQQFLQRQLDQLRQASSIPLVLRHGDPGLQNLLVSQDDTVAFLDWENAEVAGLSLWDLFYFLSAYCMKAGQVKFNLSSLDAYGQHFLHQSDLQPFVIDSIRRYCESLCLDRSLIVPLYYMFWMYRALKQSTMLAPAHVQKAFTWQILQLSMAQTNSSTLQLLGSVTF